MEKKQHELYVYRGGMTKNQPNWSDGLRYFVVISRSRFMETFESLAQKFELFPRVSGTC